MTFKEAQDAGFIQALLDGKTLQIKTYDTTGELWVDSILPLSSLDACCVSSVRIKPSPKRVPLTAEDLPPVFWVKFDGDKSWHMGLAVNEFGISFIDENRTFDSLKTMAVWSTDRKTEHPFWKEVEG